LWKKEKKKKEKEEITPVAKVDVATNYKFEVIS